METKRGVHIFKISFLLILFCITVLNVSGFSVKELLEKSSYGIVSITGMGSTGVSSVNLTLLGRNPVISLVYNTSIQSITDNSFTNVTISFEINDPDGVDTISADRARINLTKTGGSAGSPVYNYSSPTSGGCFDSGDINSTTANISCSVPVWYFSSAGEWNITIAYIEYNGSFAAQNNTHNFTLSSTIAIFVGPANITFGSPVAGEDNATSTNDPVVVNNTGNVGITSGNVRITGRNLVGEITKTQYIPAVNFTMEVVNSTTADTNAGCKNAESGSNATAFVNNTAVGITNSVLAIGNHSIQNRTSGQEHIFVCLIDVPMGLNAQSYSTLELGAWTLDVV